MEADYQYIMLHRVHPVTHKGYMLVVHTAFPGFAGRGWGQSFRAHAPRSDVIVKPIRLSRSTVRFILGAAIHTRLEEWKDDPKIHKGIPSTLEEIPSCEIRTGRDSDGDFSEIVIPDTFSPGSIMLFATDMEVSRP